MNKPLNLLLAAGVLGLASCTTMKKPVAAQPKPAITNISARAYSEKVTTEYLLFLPKGYDARGTNRWPLLLFLHGAGERGGNVWRATIHGPTKYIEQHPDFPFIVVTPWCAPGHKWSDDTLLGILDEVTAKYKVNTNRVYLSGLSMGGFGTWSLATTHPERFAAVAPVCGGEGRIGIILSMLDKDKAVELKKLPIWAFHGAKDDVVGVEESERMVAAMKKIGNKNVKFTVYPEATHNSWTQTYNNPELYQWLLQYELPRAK
jgi:predicted peptidase